MRPDRLASLPFTRSTGETLSAKMERGRISHVLVVVTGTTFRLKDKLTIKYRYNGGAVNVVDRIPCADLVEISDLKYGVPAFGSVFAADQSDPGAVGNIDINYTGAAVTSENENNYLNIQYGKNALLLPIGNIFLDSDGAQLEFIFESGTGGSSLTRQCHVNFYSIDYSNAPAHVLLWDSTRDLEQNHKLVRELYLVSKTNNSLFPSASLFGSATYTQLIGHRDIDVQMEVDGRSYGMDLLGLGAITSLIGELGRPASNIVRIFEDNDGVPSNVWLEVAGDDANTVYIIAVKEMLLPQLTLDAQHQLLNQAQKKMEALEQQNPQAAQAYVQAGLANSSSTLQAVKEQIPPPPAVKAA